jgi:REP element-mobilizing transposase RayT
VDIKDEMVLNEAGNIVQNIWNKLPEYYTNLILDAFVVMPNHVHGIIILQDPKTGAASGAMAFGL